MTPEYFSYKDILLHNHNTIIRIRKLCPKCLLLEQKDSVQKHEHHLLVKYFLSLSLEQFLITSLTFIIFTLWRLQGSYFVEFPSFGCASWWDSDYIPWAGVSQKWCCLRLPLSCQVISIYLITNDIHFNHLTNLSKVVSARFPHCNAILFPLVQYLIPILVDRYFETM